MQDRANYIFLFRGWPTFVKATLHVSALLSTSKKNVLLIDARSLEFLFLPDRLKVSQNIYLRIIYDALRSLKVYLSAVIGSPFSDHPKCLHFISYPTGLFYFFLVKLILKYPFKYFTFADYSNLKIGRGEYVSKILHHDISLFLKLHRVDRRIFELYKGELYLYSLQLLAFEASFNSFCSSHRLNNCTFYSQEGYSYNQLIKILLPSSCDFFFYTHPSHCNVCFDYVDFSSTTLVTRRRLKCVYWDRHLSNKMPPDHMLVNSILDLKTRLFSGGSHVYSPSLRSNSLDSGQINDLPLVTLFTSSLDEFEATRSLQQIFNQYLPNEPQIFESQVSAISHLAQFANTSRSFKLVIRHHPRLGAVKESTRSAYLKELVDACEDSEFVHILMPENMVSSYALILKSDLVLNCWSNIGLESLRLGKRCINLFSDYHSVCYWPQTLFPRLTTVSELENSILHMLNCGNKSSLVDLKRSLLAHSYYLYFNLLTARCISSGFPPLNRELHDYSSQIMESQNYCLSESLEILDRPEYTWTNLDKSNMDAYKAYLSDLITRELGKNVNKMGIFSSIDL